MVEQPKYDDIYVIAKLFHTHSCIMTGSQLALDGFDVFLLSNEDAEPSLVGELVSDINYCEQLSDTLIQLRKDKIIPVNGQSAVILHPYLLSDYNITDGVVVATYNDLALIYCGTNYSSKTDLYSIGEVDFREPADECYELTDLGKEFLAQNNIVDALVDDLISKISNEPVSSLERKEEEKMENLFGNLGFGKVKGNRFKISMNGIAVLQNNTQKYVVYNKDNNEFVDVTNMLFDIKDALFLLPAVEVAVGDTVIHENKPYYIVGTQPEIKAVSYDDCTQTVLIPKSTMFGIKYFYKVFSMFGDNFANTGDLFSNPMMLMALIDGKNSDLTQMMLMNAMSTGDFGSNPMMMAMLLKDDKSDDSLSSLALMSMFNKGVNPFMPKKDNKKDKD